MHGRNENAYKNLEGGYEGERLVGKPKRRWGKVLELISNR
jgi:hypothetical protein